MEFWIVFFIVVLILFILNNYLQNPYDKYTVYLMVFFLWFIGSFRYNIGTDYYAYSQWFELYANVDLMDNDIDREVGFLALIKLFNQLGLDAQAMFLFFETIIILFLYKGLRFYLKDYKSVMIALCLYTTLKLQTGYLGSLNIMRQAMVTSLIFYSSQYIILNENRKFILYLCVAMLFHKSVIIMLLLLLIIKYKEISKKTTILIVCVAVLMLALNIGGIAFEKIITFVGDMEIYEGYGNILANASISTKRHIGSPDLAVFLLFFFIFSVYYYNKKESNKLHFLYILSLIYACLRVITAFTISDAAVVGDVLQTVLHRVDAYFLPFFYCCAAYALKNNIVIIRHRAEFTFIIIFLFAVLSIRMLYGDYDAAQLSPYYSPSFGNYQYEFNFRLIK